MRISAWVCRRMTHHRTFAERVDRWFVRSEKAPLHMARVRALFLRGLGVTFLLAFASLRVQVLGLYGRRGIVPVHELLSSARHAFGRRRFYALPSIFWIDASDKALVRACRLGEGLSFALACGQAPRPTLLMLWGLYLSFVSVGGEFLAYQWDTLLLETSLHAFVLASPRSARLFASPREDPPWQVVFLMRMFAFRFFYEAGLAKLRSGDPAWRKFYACCHHYETQPLPTPLSWPIHRLPRSIQRVSTLAVVVVECVAPFTAFAPRRIRRAGFIALSTLQVLIALTGNYGFFNLLSIVLGTWLLDDSSIARVLGRQRSPRRARGLDRVFATAGLGVLLSISACVHFLRYGKRKGPHLVSRLVSALEPFRSTGAYGLFSVMTRRRTEIVIEGSDDGERWLPYEFRYKPGDPARGARWAAPHQPRLDWQMWFAAMEPPPAWFLRLLERLLEAAPEVVALFEKCPCSPRPPRYVRAELYEYRMVDRKTRRDSGSGWIRRRLGTYVPPVMLRASGA